VKHHTTPRFWSCYADLPKEIQRLADANFELLKANENHPSLHFKTIGRFRSARVGIHYRALGVQNGDHVLWFWIGHHAEYDRLVADA
jgi:hypothetical protein